MNKIFIILLCLTGVTAIFDLPLAVMLLASVAVYLMSVYLLKDAKIDKSTWIMLAAGVLISNALILVYNKFQNFIPYWDYAGYYLESLHGREDMYTNLGGFLNNVYVSMLESDYTKLPAFFVSPLLAKFDGSYGTYILLNYNLFVVPFFIALAALVSKIDKRYMVLIFLFPPFLNPLLRGYIDAVGLLYVAVLLYVVYRDDFESINVKRNIVLALFNVVFIFTRRWFLFFIVALFAAKAIEGVIRRIYNKEYKLKNLILNLFITGIIMLGIMLIFFMPYMKRLFTNGFSDTYSAYNFGNLWWNIKYFIKYYGVIVFALCLFGGVLGLVNSKLRSFTLFLILQSLFMFILFTRIQTISYHHQYLFATNMLLFVIIGLASLTRFSKPAGIGVMCVFVIYMVYSYMPLPGFLENVGFTAKRFEPKVYASERAVVLKDRLNQLTEGTEDYVYILASSELLNDDMLKNSELPQNYNAINNFFGTAHVDKRDGFPNPLLVAKYIVVADPVQVHLGVENQRIIEYFVNTISEGSLTPNLTKIESIDMGGGVTAHIYRRDSGYTDEFLNATKEYFATVYPDYPNLNNIDMIWSRN